MLNGESRAERYVDAAVRAELEELANTQGGRNAALNRAAFALGGFVAAGAIGEDDAVSQLEQACEVNGYTRKDGRASVRATIRSGLRRGMQEPRDLPRDDVPRGPRESEHRDPRPVTVASLAEYIGLPTALLARLGWRDGCDDYGRQGVEIDYVAKDGTVWRTKVRTSLSGSPKYAYKGESKRQIAYDPDAGALARENGHVLLVEGESDYVTLRHADIPAVGVPGKNGCATIERHHVDDLTVYIVQEGDPSGAEFVQNARRRLADIGFNGPVHTLPSPDGSKDVNELWQRMRSVDAFRARMHEAMRVASEPPRPPYVTLEEMAGVVLRPVGRRLTTGFPSLDQATRGGLPFGRLIVLAAPPGAGKSSLSVQWADSFERQGCAVVYVAADEPASGIVTRLGQLGGWSRDALEDDSEAGAAVRAGFAERSKGRRIAVIDPEAHPQMSTLEDAALALDHLAGDCPRVLFVDSLQTARCSSADAYESTREKTDAKLTFLRGLASRGVLVVAISEMSRGGYRTGDRKQDVSALAAGKESGAIEYGAALLLGLRSVKGEHGLVDVEVAKNRLGGAKPEFRLKLDPERASFAEVESGGPEDEIAGKRARYTKLRVAILEALRVNDCSSATAVYKLVKGTKAEVLLEVKEMLAEGALVRVGPLLKPGAGTEEVANV